MAEKEVWTVFDKSGKKRKVTVNPDDYFKGWDMFFETKGIGENNYFPAVLMYWQLLGYYIKDLAGTIVTPTQKAIAENKNIALLILDFYSLVETAGYQHILDEYRKGNIPPELENILNYQPMTNNEVFNAILDQGGFNEVVLNAVKDGKIDFTPFNDTGDPAPDWFLKYRLSPVPIPGYMGKLENMGKLTKTTEKETRIEQHKKAIKQQTKEHIINALQDGTSPEILYLLANEIKERYQAYKNAGERANYNPVLLGSHNYTNQRTAGFVVDITAGKVFDLRPHFQTMWDLLTPGIEPIKEFYLFLNRIVKNAQTPKARKKATPEQEQKLTGTQAPIFNTSFFNALVDISNQQDKKKESGGRLFEMDLITGEWKYIGRNKVLEARLPIKYDTDINIESLTNEQKAEFAIYPIYVTSQLKLLHIIALYFTLYNNFGDNYKNSVNLRVTFTLADYMRLQDIAPTPANIHDAKRRAKRDLIALDELKDIKSDKYDIEIKRLFSYAKLQRGKFTIDIALKLAEHLVMSNGFLAQFPFALLKIKERNPNAYSLGYRLAIYASNDENIRRGTSDIISVKSALQYCPAIPTIEKVKAMRGSAEQKIINPFEKALNFLCGLTEKGKTEVVVLESWEYCLAHKKPLPDDRADVRTYDYFSTLYIKFKFANFEPDAKRIEEITERRKQEAESKTIKGARKIIANAKRKAKQKQQEQQ